VRVLSRKSIGSSDVIAALLPRLRPAQLHFAVPVHRAARKRGATSSRFRRTDHADKIPAALAPPTTLCGRDPRYAPR
jgi:hypothetical protein